MNVDEYKRRGRTKKGEWAPLKGLVLRVSMGGGKLLPSGDPSARLPLYPINKKYKKNGHDMNVTKVNSEIKSDIYMNGRKRHIAPTIRKMG